MNEASVSGPFMSELRLRLGPDCPVVKHRDQGMIGLVDCSATFRGTTLWVEFKLVVPKASWGPGPLALQARQLESIDKEREASPVQSAMADRLAKSGHCLYLMWFHKSRHAFFFHPLTRRTQAFYGQGLNKQLASYVASGGWSELEAPRYI